MHVGTYSSRLNGVEHILTVFTFTLGDVLSLQKKTGDSGSKLFCQRE
jgi:hypothetical protein